MEVLPYEMQKIKDLVSELNGLIEEIEAANSEEPAEEETAETPEVVKPRQRVNPSRMSQAEYEEWRRGKRQ